MNLAIMDKKRIITGVVLIIVGIVIAIFSSIEYSGLTAGGIAETIMILCVVFGIFVAIIGIVDILFGKKLLIKACVVEAVFFVVIVCELCIIEATHSELLSQIPLICFWAVAGMYYYYSMRLQNNNKE